MLASEPPNFAPCDGRAEDRSPARIRSVRRWLMLLAIALLVRGGTLAARRATLAEDPDAYRALAENLANHGTFGFAAGDDRERTIVPTAFRPPLYPLALAPLVVDERLSSWGVAALHLALGLATVAGATWLGGRWGLGERRFLAGVLVACDPLLLHQSTLVMTETLAAGLVLLVLIAVQRLREVATPSAAALVGGAIGAAALCRPTFLPFCLLVAALELTGLACGGAWRGRIVRAGLIVGATALVVSPWALRNHAVFGRPLATTTHGGYTLLLGNNPSFYEFLRSGSFGDTWAPESLAAMTVGCGAAPTDAAQRNPAKELAEDARLDACARRHMSEEPGSACHAAVYRIGQLWSPLAHATSAPESLGRRLARYAAALWYVALFGATLRALGVGRRELLRGPWTAGLLLCLLFTLVHSLYWSNPRMRAPLMPLVAILAASALGRGTDRAARRVRSGPASGWA